MMACEHGTFWILKRRELHDPWVSCSPYIQAPTTMIRSKGAFADYSGALGLRS
jgi:hypothetical protein